MSDLDQLLGARLLQRMTGRASPLYSVTWTNSFSWRVGHSQFSCLAETRWTARSWHPTQTSLWVEDWAGWTSWFTPRSHTDWPCDPEHSESIGTVLASILASEDRTVADLQRGASGRCQIVAPELYCWLMGYPRSWLDAAPS